MKLFVDMLELARSLVYFFCITFTVIVCSILYMVWLLFLPRKFLWHYWVRPCAWLCLRSAGQKMVIEGNPPDPAQGPYLYLLNHESFFDTFMVSRGINHYITALAAKSYFRLPIWGWMMRLHGVIPINRKQRDEAFASLDMAETAIKNGVSVVAFPEGTRTSNGLVQPFKKGVFHLAIKSQVTIVPVVIEGAYESWRKGSWIIRPGRLSIKFLKPIAYTEYRKEYLLGGGVNSDGIDAIATLVRDRIVDDLFRRSLQ